MALTQDEIVRRIAASRGTTLAIAAELLAADPELAEQAETLPASKGIDSPDCDKPLPEGAD